MTGLLSTKEAAKILGLAPQTLAIMRLRGSSLPHVKLGRRCLYDPADLQRYIHQNKRTSTADKRTAEDGP